MSAAGVESSETNAGAYLGDLSITGQSGSSGFLASNYAITYGTGDYTVNRRAITIDLWDQSKFVSETFDLDTSAFTVFDPLSNGSTLPNGELVTGVTFSPLGVPGQRALPGLYPNALDADSTQGSNGFDTSNYTISFIPGNLLVKNYPVPAITPAEAFPSDRDFVFGGEPWVQLKDGVPAVSSNGLPKLLASAAWKSLTRMQQERIMARLGQTDDPEELNEELLEYLIADAKAQ